MKDARIGQVEPEHLLFGMNWEDPESDRRALAIRPGDTVVAITSGGCNAFSLLLENPGRLYAVDINACQSHLMELKRAAIRRLSFGDLHAFLGLRASRQRREMFELLAPELSDAARAYWRTRPEAIVGGVIYQGRYEGFLVHFRRVLGLIHGRRRIERLFECRTLEEQREFFRSTWNTFAWRALFRIASNKRVLSRGLSHDYFRFDDGSGSSAQGLFGRAQRAFCEIPVSTNYFLAQYLLGRYVDSTQVPPYLREENLPVVRARLDRLEIVTADLKRWLATRPPGTIDAMSLSNICEMMSLEDTARTFEEVWRTARPGAGICLRNLMVPRSAPRHMAFELRDDVSDRLQAADRSFVYAKVQALSVVPAVESIWAA